MLSILCVPPKIHKSNNNDFGTIFVPDQKIMFFKPSEFVKLCIFMHCSSASSAYKYAIHSKFLQEIWEFLKINVFYWFLASPSRHSKYAIQITKINGNKKQLLKNPIPFVYKPKVGVSAGKTESHKTAKTNPELEKTEKSSKKRRV